MTGFALANIGAFASFLPLIQILLPLKARELAPRSAEELLATVAATGAVVAGIANFAAGWLSDRTRSAFGRRRPWIIGGALGVMGSYGLIWRANTATELLLAFVAFQIAFNAMFAPLLALIPDRVPVASRGWASALVALGLPAGTALGALVTGMLLTRGADRYAALAAIVFISIVPFALSLGHDPGCNAVEAGRVAAAAPDGRWSRNFVLGWFARACVTTAFSVTQLFLLFYVQSIARPGPAHQAERDIAMLGMIFGITTALAGLISGRASDLAGRRKPMVVGGALAVATGMLALATAQSWPFAIGAYVLFALGAGCHTATDFALMIGLLPSRDRAARDLGVLNLSNIAPQIVAPLLATTILRVPGADIHWVFAGAGAMAVLGAVLVGFMRRVR